VSTRHGDAAAEYKAMAADFSANAWAKGKLCARPAPRQCNAMPAFDAARFPSQNPFARDAPGMRG
jgi:hypothetical protein